MHGDGLGEVFRMLRLIDHLQCYLLARMGRFLGIGYGGAAARGGDILYHQRAAACILQSEDRLLLLMSVETAQGHGSRIHTNLGHYLLAFLLFTDLSASDNP